MSVSKGMILKCWLMLSVTAVLSFWSSTSAYAHGDESRVSLEIDADSPVRSGDVVFSIQLIDSKKKSLISDRELSIVHEKKLHLFIFDAALQEFRHEHPEYQGSAWQVKTSLPVDGHYWVWAQGELAAGGEEFAASARLDVAGGAPAYPPTPALGETRSGSDGLSVVSISKSRLVARKMAMLDVTFSRKDGSTPQITPWLGASAHVVGVLSDGDTLVHTHPMDHGKAGQLMLHVTFPEAGDYRLWVQFQDGGQLRLVPLSVTVHSR